MAVCYAYFAFACVRLLRLCFGFGICGLGCFCLSIVGFGCCCGCGCYSLCRLLLLTFTGLWLAALGCWFGLGLVWCLVGVLAPFLVGISGLCLWFTAGLVFVDLRLC